MRDFIPFTKPYLGEEEKQAVLRVLDSGRLGGNGPMDRELAEYMQQRFGVRHVLPTTSCSHAMELAAMALCLEPGDEVITPSFAYVTSASSMVRVGARPVFVDIDEATWNVDPALVEAAITPRTRAILPVHYAGQGCDMGALMDIARRHGLYVIEDAAQAVGARWDGRWLGTIGHVGCYSFHVTKNVICGEGGAFLTDDDAIAERAEIMREKGTNRAKFLRGEVDKYTWVDVGSSYVPSDLLMAIALAQFRKLEAIHAARRRVWERYHAGLAGLAERGAIVRHRIDPRAEINWHIYAFRTVSRPQVEVLTALKERGIGATFHFVPLHASPYGRDVLGYRPGDLPITERVAASLIRLPLYPDLAADDQDHIIECLYDIYR